MHQHVIRAHLGIEDYKSVLRFEVIEKHQTAFSRQLAEAINMKNKKAVILNLKDDIKYRRKEDILKLKQLTPKETQLWN